MSTAADQPPTVTDAIVAYVGREAGPFPSNDEAAVLALDPPNFPALMSKVISALLTSDRIELEDVPRADRVEVATAEHRRLLPDLDDRAIEALVWRWSFLEFHG